MYFVTRPCPCTYEQQWLQLRTEKQQELFNQSYKVQIIPLAIYIASGIDTHACMKAIRNTPGYGWCVLGRLIIGEFHMHACI